MTVPLVALLLACTPHLYSPEETGEVEDWSWEAPENTWTSAEPPNGLEGQGWHEGDVVPDFRLVDQFGQEVSLWQFYGQIILLDHSTYWCSVCQDLAWDVDETWHAFADQGFMYVTLLSQNLENEVPSVEELAGWADYYGITAPVLADDAGIADTVVGGEGFPRLQLIGRDMRMVNEQVVPTTDAQIRAEVEALL
jgi:peroxiredoxin